MAKRGGQLNWRRMSIVLQGGDNPIDTGICFPDEAFEPGQPVLDGRDPVPPADPGVASRLMVIPLIPYLENISVAHEPYVDPTTKTVHVVINNSGAPETANLLFWAPSPHESPGMADTYIALNPRPPGPGLG